MSDRIFYAASPPEQEIILRLGLECDAYLYLSNDGWCTLDGTFSASDLHKIADELKRTNDTASTTSE